METDSLEIVDMPAGRGYRALVSHAVPAVRVNLAQVLLAGKDDWKKICFVGPAGEIRYDQFVTAVRRLASALQGQGVREDQRLALALDDSIEQAAIFYASLAVGAVPLVLNPRLDAGTLAGILADCQAAWIFTQTEQLGEIQRAQHALTFSVRIAHADPGALTARALDWVPASADPSWDLFPERGLDDLAFLQYTSGTTGAPKGVMHTARSALSACASFAATRLGLHAQDRIYSVPKAFFGYGMGNSLLFPLYVGAQAVLDARWPTPAVVRENLRRFAPSVLFAVPTIYRRLLEETDFARTNCSLRLAFSAGAPLPEATREAWWARVGLELHDGIGATELCHVFATTYPDAVRPGSLGRMLPGYRHRIIDEQGAAVVLGEVGVLMVEAPCAAIGYWNNPDDTRKKFSHGWYRTGDLFSEDVEGWLYFHGREDDRFKVFGRWVVPLVLEEWVKARFPQVQEAFVIPVSPPGGEVRPVLLLQPGRGDAGALAEIVRAAMGEAFEHHQRPVCCLSLDTVPCNANGKVDRRVLTRRAQTALDDGAQSTSH